MKIRDEIIDLFEIEVKDYADDLLSVDDGADLEIEIEDDNIELLSTEINLSL